jgi:glutathione peroxidase
MANFHDFALRDIDGDAMPLERFQGKAVLVVNVASRCGLTPQYEGLEAIWREGRDMGLVVLGVPCNQFGRQEPGTEGEIKQFCSLNYDVSFPMASKIDVNGAQRHPLYQWLAGPGARFPGDIQWNFEKFLIGPDGEVRARFAPDTSPQDGGLKAAIAEALPA